MLFWNKSQQSSAFAAQAVCQRHNQFCRRLAVQLQRDWKSMQPWKRTCVAEPKELLVFWGSTSHFSKALWYSSPVTLITFWYTLSQERLTIGHWNAEYSGSTSRTRWHRHQFFCACHRPVFWLLTNMIWNIGTQLLQKEDNWSWSSCYEFTFKDRALSITISQTNLDRG